MPNAGGGSPEPAKTHTGNNDNFCPATVRALKREMSTREPSQAMGAARREPGGGESPMERARAVRNIPFMLGCKRQIQHKQKSRTDTMRRGAPIFGKRTPPHSCVLYIKFE